MHHGLLCVCANNKVCQTSEATLKNYGKPKKKLKRVLSKKQELQNKRLFKSMISYRNKKKKFHLGNEAKFSQLDYKRINRLLYMGIVIKVKKKKDFEYKVWVSRFPHLYAKARTPVSAYRRLFKILKEERGVYFP